MNRDSLRSLVKSSGAAALLAATVLFTACNYHSSKAGDQPNAEVPGDFKAGAKDFAVLKAEIFQSKCLTCHNGTDEVALDTVGSFQSRLPDIRARLTTDGRGHMPPSRHAQLTASELSTVLAWIDVGAPETVQDEAAKPQPPPRTPGGVMGYYELREFVLNAKCVTCHVGTNPVGDSDDFSTYFGTFAFKGSIKKRILLPANDHDHMPPYDSNGDEIHDRPQLTPEEIKAIVDWVDAGGPI